MDRREDRHTPSCTRYHTHHIARMVCPWKPSSKRHKFFVVNPQVEAQEYHLQQASGQCESRQDNQCNHIVARHQQT